MVEPSRIRISGPLAPQVDGLRSYLLGQGYTPLSIRNLLHLMSHLSRWLDGVGMQAGELTRESIEAFLQHRRRAGYVAFRTARSLDPILEYLEGAGVLALPEPVAGPRTALEELLNEYERFLVSERALQPATARYYQVFARSFLSKRLGSDCLELSQLNADGVVSFILRQSRTLSVGRAKLLVTALRSLLRFLYLRGDLETELAGAVPAVAGWRQASLPRFLSPEEVQRLVGSCDRRTIVGRRDFAVLLLLARLGLRRGEVVALELGDVHWRPGEIVVRGKGCNDARLPLPTDVGEAVAAYLQQGRPPSTSRALFLSARAPYRRLSHAGVAAIVYGAAVRAGLSRLGAHRLRHTAATQMLRHGASLSHIAQVLRHRRLETTAIYAKVDRTALRALAQPWPGGVA